MINARHTVDRGAVLAYSVAWDIATEVIMREQIAEFLAKGHKRSEIAQYVGCTTQNIDEYMGDESFRELVRAKLSTEREERMANKYNALEESTLKALHEQLALCETTDMINILHAIAKIRSANRPVLTNASFAHPTVGITLIMPQQNLPRVITNDVNQVVAIGEQTLAPMPAANVREMFNGMIAQEKEIEREAQYAKAQLPPVRGHKIALTMPISVSLEDCPAINADSERYKDRTVEDFATASA